MNTVTEDILKSKISKDLSKFPQEIILKIQQTITSPQIYLDATWASRLIHGQKMTLLYLCGVIDDWTTVSEISINTGIPKIATQKTIRNLIKHGYIKSDDFSMSINENISFTFKFTKKIIDEYLLNLIHSTRFLKNGDVYV